ncbi:MAG: complex I subunit 5 family protein [Motilibacteraceae bacterium]
MGSSQLAPLAVAVPVLVACLALSLGRHLPRAVVDVAGVLTAAAVAGLAAALVALTGQDRVVTWVGGWRPHGGTGVGIALVVDRVGAGAALLAALLTTAALLYSWRYLESVEAHYHALMLLFLAGMTGFALSGDLFDMFVFFELMGVAAYVLTGYKVEDKSALQGALNFAVVNSLGAYLTLFGIGILYARTGELGLAQLHERLSDSPSESLVVVAFTLVATGFLVKAAALPFHFWLADAHAVAPAPVCVLFSGVMVELGAYAVIRVYWDAFSGALPHADVHRVLMVLGVATALVGALMCFLQRHLKRLLAYSTIAHTGLFLLALGALDADSSAGALTYVLGHAGVKAALFLLAGLLLNRYDSVDELSLYGRARDSRFAGVLFAVGGLALAGLPPFGVALGKGVSEEGLVKAGLGWAPVLFAVVSAVTGAAVLRAAGRVFLGLGPDPEQGAGAGGSAGSEAGSDETSGNEEQPETSSLPKGQWVMTLTVLALLVASLLVGVVPAVRRAVAVGAAQLVDSAGFVAASLHGQGTGPLELPAVDWTAQGVALSLLSCGLAVALAAAALWLPEAAAGWIARILGPATGVLRRLHSGHVGDYAAWLLVGVGAVALLAGLPGTVR